jgi:uncharacterized protein
VEQILNELISAILQLLVALLLPFIFFWFRKDKSKSFKQYIGFTPVNRKTTGYIVGIGMLFLVVGLVMVFMNESVRQAVFEPKSVTGKLRSMGLSATSVIILLIIAWLKTSLSEEIFFRGFIAKRLISLMGFNLGNLLQAFIFGAIHFFLFWKLTNASLGASLFLFAFSTLAGWSIGYMKEKIAGGSIIPGWIAHGAGNMISYFIIAFVI